MVSKYHRFHSKKSSLFYQIDILDQEPNLVHGISNMLLLFQLVKNLVLLKKRGYLDSEIVKEGEMPEKTIYSVNDKGRNYFMHMMKKYSEEPAMVYIDFVAFVSNLYHVEPNIGIEMIGSLRNKLAEERAYIQQNIKEKKEFVPFHALSILELYDQMYSLFSDWIEKIAQEYAAVNNL